MSATTTTTTPRPARYSRTTMVRELRAYGVRPAERRVPRGEWEQQEWDRLAELAMGVH